MAEHPGNRAEPILVDGIGFRPMPISDGLVVLDAVDGSTRTHVMGEVEFARLAGRPAPSATSPVAMERMKGHLKTPDRQLGKATVRCAVGLALLQGRAERAITYSDQSLVGGWAWIKARAMEIAGGDEMLDCTALAFIRLGPPTAKTSRHWRDKAVADRPKITDFVHKGADGGRAKSSDPDLRPVFAAAENDYLSRKDKNQRLAVQAGIERMEGFNAERERLGLDPLHVGVAAIVRALSRFRKENPHLCTAARGGKEAAKKVHIGTVEQPPVDRIGARMEPDGHTADVWTFAMALGFADRIDPRLRPDARKLRIRLIIAQDIATMYVLGLYIDVAETSHAAHRCLDLVCRDKRRWSEAAGCSRPWCYVCVPDEVVSDMGSAFIHRARIDGCAFANISTILPRAVRPRGRAKVERSIHTISYELGLLLDGRVATNFRQMSDELGIERCCLIVDEFLRCMVRWICDVYHHRPHGGLQGRRSPAQMWDHRLATTSVLRVLSGAERRVAFGQSVMGNIQHYGIELPGLTYQSIALQDAIEQQAGQLVRVFVDRLDMGMVSVYAGGRVIDVPCSDPLMEGITFDEVEATRRLYAQRPGRGAVLPAKARTAMRAIESDVARASALARIISPTPTRASTSATGNRRTSRSPTPPSATSPVRARRSWPRPMSGSQTCSPRRRRGGAHRAGAERPPESFRVR